MRHRHGANAPIISAFYHPRHEKKQIKARIFLSKFSGHKEKQGIRSYKSLAYFVPLREMLFL
jgi:hypothetical protein